MSDAANRYLGLTLKKVIRAIINKVREIRRYLLSHFFLHVIMYAVKFYNFVSFSVEQKFFDGVLRGVKKKARIRRLRARADE